MSSPPSPRPFTRVLIVLAAVVIVLAGVRQAASFLNPILFALVFSTLFAPIYAWLKHRGLPNALALLLVLLLQFAVFGTLFYVLGISLNRFIAQLGTYSAQLDTQLAALQAALPTGGAPPGTFSGNTLMALLGAVAAAVAAFLGSFLYIQVLMLFFILEGPSIVARLRASVGANHPQVGRLPEIGRSVVRQFGLRAVVNAVTGTGIALWLLILGVDFPFLWGILTFFLSYVPYIGIVVATIPSVVLAFAEYGLTQALLVIVGVAVANVAAENLLSPLLMSRGLSMSPTAVFLAFAFWTWLLGAPGAFLGMPITFFLLVMFATYPGTRWLASVMTVGPARQQPSRESADTVDSAA